MGNDQTKLIEDWFAAHDGDGEFAQGIRSIPYSVVWPSKETPRLLVTTKPITVSRVFADFDMHEQCGMVGRYGLPSVADTHWIRKLFGDGSMLFFGDMDPVDLMIYAWLRTRLQPIEVAYLGISDALLAAMRVSIAKLPYIPLAASELKSLTLLDEVFPDLSKTVGPKCARKLQKGLKVEIEAVLGADKKRVASILAQL